MYQCNCGELFNNPEERTAHTASCPVMADKTMKQDWGGDSGQIAYEAGIEKGKQMERERIIKMIISYALGDLQSVQSFAIKVVEVLKEGKDV